MAQKKKKKKSQEFPCELMYKIFVKHFFCQLQTRREKLQKLIPAQLIIISKRSHDFTFGSLRAKQLLQHKHKSEALSRRCYRSRHISHSSHRSPTELFLYFFSLSPLFEASTRLTGTQKHQQARLLPFRGFSSASATQMMNQSKNMDLIFFFFFFHMCVTASSTRNKCVFLRDRNCRTV